MSRKIMKERVVTFKLRPKEHAQLVSLCEQSGAKLGIVLRGLMRTGFAIVDKTPEGLLSVTRIGAFKAKN